MRHKRIRAAIVQTLRENPSGLTANQIIERLDPKKRKKITNAKHIGNLLRGLKGVRKNMSVLVRSELAQYKVNVYYYDEDEGAEI